MSLEDLNIIDIAHALSLQCRYNGHTNGFYSVAQHSVVVAMILHYNDRFNPNLAFAGLLHDAVEAYLPDVPTPIKEAMGPAWDSAENGLDDLIRFRFGVDPLSDTEKKQLHSIDKGVCVEEERVFLYGKKAIHIQPVENWNHCYLVEGWSSVHAKREFILCFDAFRRGKQHQYFEDLLTFNYHSRRETYSV